MPNILEYQALATRVLAVATVGAVNDWCVYIDAVEGKNHETEALYVALDGNKQSKEMAEFLFPHFAEKYKYRE